MAIEKTNVDKIKSDLQRRGARWQAGSTRMTKLSLEEAMRHLGGAIHPDDVPLDDMESVALDLHQSAKARRATSLRAAPGPTIPTETDWRSQQGQSFVTSVKFQGACGTCTVFSTAAATEAAICITTNTPPRITNGVEYPDLSEAQMFYCGAASQGRNCAAGWYLPSALSLLQATGAAPESYFPYESGDQPCNIKPGWESVVTKISGSTKFASPDDMKSWIATKGPIAVMLVAYQDLFAYTTGVYQHVSGQRLGAHSVCVVGYSDSQEAWLCKNSWSTQWGEQGYFWMGYGECGVESAAHGLNGLALIDGQPPNAM